jgi:hypothetical protein
MPHRKKKSYIYIQTIIYQSLNETLIAFDIMLTKLQNR